MAEVQASVKAKVKPPIGAIASDAAFEAPKFEMPTPPLGSTRDWRARSLGWNG